MGQQTWSTMSESQDDDHLTKIYIDLPNH